MKHALMALAISAFAMSLATLPACFAEAPPGNFEQLAQVALSACPSVGGACRDAD